MYEATVRIEPGGPYGEATAGTDVSIELWCNDSCDLLHIHDPSDDAVFDEVATFVGIKDELVEGDHAVIITDECLKRQEELVVERYLVRHDCLFVPPLRYADGAKFCRVLALDGATLTAFYRDLVSDFSVTVESKREVRFPSVERPLLTLDAILPTLSDRQREALLTAYDRGYYEVPRRTTTAELAAEIGIGRRTAENHLRRAENKVMSSMIEYVRTAPFPTEHSG